MDKFRDDSGVVGREEFGRGYGDDGGVGYGRTRYEYITACNGYNVESVRSPSLPSLIPD